MEMEKFEPRKNITYREYIAGETSAENIEAIRQKLVYLNTHVPLERLEEMMKDISDFHSQMEEKYPDWEKYMTLNVLIGSTPKSGDRVTDEDLEGDDSVVKFVDNLIEKYSQTAE